MMIFYRIENFQNARIESNWSPFDLGGTLHYVYLYNPLRIVKCDVGDHLNSSLAPCHFAYEVPRDSSMLPSDGRPNVRDMSYTQLILRGGTPLMLYKTLPSEYSDKPGSLDHYYLGMLHSTVYREKKNK